MKPTFNIAVRAMVEHVLRCGDLRSDFMGSAGALEGIRAHQRVQRGRPADYQAEVAVSLELKRPDYDLKVGGRIDGVFRDNERVMIEEIKTTRAPLQEIEASPDPIHWGQAQCYAHMYAVQENLTQVEVRLTYVHLDNGRVLEMVRNFECGELALFFNDLLERYLLWLQQMWQWVLERDRSIEQLAFPFETYRAGQREMAVEVFRTIRDGAHLLVQAATGIGKTMAALYPAVKALGRQHVPKVVFLTARTTGRLAAEAALQALGQRGMRLKRITLTAKEKICFSAQKSCSPEECPFAKGYFDRINNALGAAFTHDAMTREAIEKVAVAFQVCPFELSLELANWADCVICDYNYAFDPTVSLRRLFGEEAGGHALLVDEAHNLVDRSREMFSARLNKQAFLVLRRNTKKDLPRIYRALGRINSWMAALRKRCMETGGLLIEKNAPDDLIERLRAFAAAAEHWLRLNQPADFREELLQTYFDSLAFIRIAERYSEGYATISEAVAKDVQIKLFCMDTSEPLRNCWRTCRAAVLFSATLAPADYFQAVLGCHPDARKMCLTSPFPPANLAVFLASRISTFYRRRQDSCQALSRAMAEMVMQRQGHYLLFFPSYEYLTMVLDCFRGDCSDVDVIVQTREMSESDREAFLAKFGRQVERTLVGFAVMGGIFGEGIDLKGERLTGAIIVGVGLPAIGTERELIREYYDRTQGLGFEFAYQYPGINRVLQAAGRVIRSETDRGVVLLIDPRYIQRRYHSLLPPWWQLQPAGPPTEFRAQLAEFWGRQ
ncbi:MAG: ATP-dependent DNA helicase [Desulfobacteraceae bacterium]|nr:MAG: ATP-dependent DNA helicase [Desulfobacteraceae bacterium]